MSYPMPQDIGFDPTLSVERGVLIREVASAGQSRLSAGFICPLHFVADAATRVRLGYAAAWPAAGATLKLLLAAEDGRKFEAALPASGSHDATVSGGELKLPAVGVAIEAIVLVGSAAQPAKGANNRIELHGFEVDAMRPAEVPLVHPALLTDPDRARVAAEVVDPAVGLRLEVREPVRIVLRDDRGRAEVQRALPAGPQTVSLGGNARPGLWTARLETPDAATEFSFLVLGTVPGHPRVLLSGERLAQLKSQPGFAALRQQIQEQARAQAARLKDAAAAGAQIAALPVGRSLRPSFDGELTEYFQTVEGFSNAIASSALDYALTGDTASLETARRDLLALAKWPTWTPPRFASHGMHTYYETGIVAQRLAFAYDLIAGTLSPEDRRALAEAFRTKCIEPAVAEYFTYDRMPTADSNWMANSLGGAIAAAVAVADLPGWREREGAALAELLAAYEHNLRGLFPGDGSELEPAGYEHFAMQGLSWGAAALHSLGIRPAGMERMLQGFWLPDYAMARPAVVLDGGDFNGEFRTLSGFAFGAEFGGIPALRAFYDRVPRRGAPGDLLDLLCCTQAAEPAGEAPRSRIFGMRGSAVFRSGWGADDTVVALRAGPWFNHEHHDQGSFQVAAFGTRLISEAGYANYYLDPNYAGYFTQASGHNTVLVDGDAFSQGEYDAPFWRALDKHAKFTGHLLSAKFDYVAADLAPAYEGRVSRYQRQYLFLAPDVLIVRDDLSAAEAHAFTWQMHAVENAAVKANGGQATIRAGDTFADIAAAGTWQVEPMPLPARIEQYLGNVLLHPGERQEPHRYALRLNSPKTTSTNFEVRMHFRKAGTAIPASQPWGLFRNGTGDLRFQDMASDAAVFAGRSADAWIAIGARTVRNGPSPLLTASAPVNAAWSRSADAIELDLQLNAAASVAVRAQATAVTVDGTPVRYREVGGRVELPRLSQGGHHVRIAVR